MRSSCLCGAVRWTAADPQSLSHCHCGRCRKQHGVAFATYAMVAADGFRMEGADAIASWESTPGFARRFCRHCGSIVPAEPTEGFPFAFVPAGNFDDDTALRPAFHIFVASKAPWYEIPDALPRFDAFPPGIDAPVWPSLAREHAGDGIAGSCSCGAVAFTLTAPPFFARNCHCQRCRKARSAAHAANMLNRASEIRWERGAEHVAHYKIPDARFFTQCFCDVCGAKVPRVDPSRDYAITPLGSLDTDPGIRPTEHIFTASKAPWFDIADALPQHPAAPPS